MMDVAKKVLATPRRVLRKFQSIMQHRKLRKSLKHISGPRKFRLGDDDVALVLVGRNVSYYLRDYYEYHRAMGIGYFVYLDNGSSDESIAIASKMDNTIVASCDLNFAHYEATIRLYATTEFLSGGWRLVVDADERFDFPGSSHLKLPVLARKLNARGFNAVVAQMLDMVPAGSAERIGTDSFAHDVELCNTCSLNDISKYDYFSEEIEWRYFLHQNRISNGDIKVYFGGIRRSLFGEFCCLTKHPLFRVDAGVLPLPHPHVSTGLHCADFSALLRHYKFSGDFVRRETRLLAENRVAHGETALRIKKIEGSPEFNFSVPGSSVAPSTEDLLASGFLVASEDARCMLGL